MPIIDMDSVKHLFEFLCSHKVGKPLLSLQIQRGAWRGRSHGQNAYVAQYQGTRFHCSADMNGRISISKSGSKDYMEIAEEIRATQKKWDTERSGFQGFSENEVDFLIRVLIGSQEERELVPFDFLTRVLSSFCEERDLVAGEIDYSLLDSIQYRGEVLSRSVLSWARTFMDPNVPVQGDYAKELEEARVKARRRRAMMEAFAEDCTLYDILRSKEC